MTLTHVADTGLRLEDNDKMLDVVDSDLSVHWDGTDGHSTCFLNIAVGSEIY